APRWANFALQNADLLLVIGSRLDIAMTAYAHNRFARGAVKIMVDIDTAEIEKMQMDIALPVMGDARAFIEAMLSELKPRAKQDFAPWLARIAHWKERYPLLQ